MGCDGCKGCIDCKTTEAKITIIIPELLEEKTTQEVVNETMEKNSDAKYGYHLIITEDGISIGDDSETGKPDAIVIMDRELDNETVVSYYDEVMSYHQGIEEEGLSEEDYATRDKEVKEKWLNGNFNWWILDYKKEA